MAASNYFLESIIARRLSGSTGRPRPPDRRVRRWLNNGRIYSWSRHRQLDRQTIRADYNSRHRTGGLALLPTLGGTSYFGVFLVLDHVFSVPAASCCAST